MLFAGSRYARTAVITPVRADGSRPQVLAARRIPPTPALFEYVVVEGERLDHLASRFYGDPRKYWLILDANPEELNPLLLLRPGRRIQIPQDRAVST
ncbi:MAG: tail protein X [Micromonosporaceae bacterium]